MDFKNILGRDGQSLTTYITEQIVAESQALTTLVEGMISSATSNVSREGHTHQLELGVKGPQ